MKAFVVLSLLAVAYAVTNHGLGEIANAATQNIVVTAAYPTDGAPTLTALNLPTAYNSGANPLGVYTFTAAGTYAQNNTVTSLAVQLTNGGDNVWVAATVQTASDNGAGTFTTTLAGLAAPKFLNDGAYTVSSLVYYTSNFKTYTVSLPTGAAATTTAQKYTPPTLAAFSLVSPQNLGCDDSGCTVSTGYPNGTATLLPAARADLVLTVLAASPVAASSFWYTFSGTGANNAIDFNDDTVQRVTASVAGWDSFGNFEAQISKTASATILPKNGALSIAGGFITEQGTFGTNIPAATIGGYQATVVSTVGGADVTAPTCTVATLSPATIQTVNANVDGTITITCADEASGSGLWIKGAFGTVTSSVGASFTVALGAFTTADDTFPVAPYISGTLQLAGVFAIDNAGNAALYGSCGGITGWDSLCGGGSSASTVTLSLMSIVILAIFSLFA